MERRNPYGHWWNNILAETVDDALYCYSCGYQVLAWRNFTWGYWRFYVYIIMAFRLSSDLALIEGPPNQALAAMKWCCLLDGSHCSKTWRHTSVQNLAMLDFFTGFHTVEAYSSWPQHPLALAVRTTRPEKCDIFAQGYQSQPITKKFRKHRFIFLTFRNHVKIFLSQNIMHNF